MKTKVIDFGVCLGIAVLLFAVGVLVGSKVGYVEGVKQTTETRNQKLDIKPYDASLKIKALEYTDISPAGFTIYFDTNKTTGSTIYGDDVYDLACEWTVSPSARFTRTPVRVRFGRPSLMAMIKTYPGGGTIMFRIVAEDRNYGSAWFYIDLPRVEG